MIIVNGFDNVIVNNGVDDGDDNDDDDDGHDNDDDGVIVIILTCAVLSPKCRKLLHSSSLQEGNLKEGNFLYIFVVWVLFVSFSFCIFSL